MLETKLTSQFKKDSRRAKKRDKYLSKLKAITQKLRAEKSLDQRYLDHPLSGQPYLNCRECHIEPDWLLVYKVSEGYLYLVRTGSHSDLFRS